MVLWDVMVELVCSSTRVRWPKNIGKRWLKSLVGCPTPPMAIMSHPGTCSGPPGAIPETSQGSPKALLELTKPPRTSDEPAVTKQQ